MQFIENSSYFGFILTILIFFIAVTIKNKTKSNLLNPLLITTIIIVLILLLFKIDYTTYNNSAKYISYFLTPTTVCLAIPLYRQVELLKKNFLAIISGILAGVIANGFIIILFVNILKLNKNLGISLLSKSITAPIAMALTEELGCVEEVPITVFAVILSGIIGAAIAPTIFKLLYIKNRVAKGLACGTAAHGSGTTTALELGEVEGAMSGLAIIVTGLITTLIAPLLKYLFF